MEPQPAAPPVVVVVVTTDPGDWFEECLASLAKQDYPNLSILVVDTASSVDPTPRVARVLPRAFVRRLPQRVGFGRAANQALDVVEGASHFLFCHDDVALAPDAVRLLVEEAFRSNAGVATPKQVRWDDPRRLVAVGAGANRLGVVHPLLEPGELDQAQHDAVRDVFVAPSGATLVRADLFASLRGFSPAIDQHGEDLDLCWRAQVAGARVVSVPAARVRHRQVQLGGLRSGWRSAGAARRARQSVDQHRLRTAFTCYGFLRLLAVVPAAALHALAEALIHLARGDLPAARAALAAPRAAARDPRALWAARRRVQRQRRVPDRDVARLQTRGDPRLRALLRSAMLFDPAEAADGSATVTVMERLRPRMGWRWGAVTAVVVVAVFLIGGRSLLAHPIPAIGQLPVTAGGAGRWWQLWWAPWRPDGLGSAAPAPPGLGLLALAASVLGGAAGLLQHVVVLGPLLVGPWGMWRAARRFGSRRGGVAAVVVYAALPLVYDSLATGRWGALLTFAAMPWIFSALASAGGAAPLRGRSEDRWGRVVGTVRLGLLVALLGAFVPSALVVVVVLGVAMGAVQALTGEVVAGARSLVRGVAAAVIGAVLLLPWSAGTLGSAVALFGVGGSTPVGLGQVVRFATGPVGSAPLGWALLAAAVLPLVVGRSWRLAWAARCWGVGAVFWGLTWAGLRGWLPFPVGDPGVALAPAAVAVAMAAGLGAAAFDRDLPGYRFGWRQLVSAAAALGVVVGAVPVLGAAAGGRWDLPGADASSALMLPPASAGHYRVLWVGAPSALPLASWRLAPGVGYATSLDGEPDVSDLWTSPGAGATPLLATDLDLATTGRTTTLGHLLAPMGVRYLVIPNHNAPSGSGAQAVPVPGSLLTALAAQTDLHLTHPDPDYTVYVNSVWAPVVALTDRGRLAGYEGTAPASALARQRALLGVPLAGSRPVLTGARLGTGRARTPGGTLYVGSTFSGRWTVVAAGRRVHPVKVFGWAMAFPVGPGRLTVAVTDPAGARAWQVGEALLWLLVVAGLAWDGRRRHQRRSRLPVSEEVAVVDLRHRRGVPLAAAGMEPEEVWADG